MPKCLVTGGAGFIGSVLVDKLIELGNKVICIDNESAKNEIFYWNSKASNIKENILKFEKINRYFQDVDFVFHLAAESRITNAIENPTHTYEINLIGTENILKSCLIHNVKRFVLSSTSSVYGLNKAPNVETDSFDCLNPYSLSKLFSEQLSNYYNKNFNLPVTILRYFNVFGARAPSNGQYAPVTGIFMKQFKQNKSLTIVGDGSSLRDFVHVDDVVKANIMFIDQKQKIEFNDTFNVGSGENISVKSIADMISNNQIFVPPRSGEAKITLANIEKIKKITGWKPSISISKWISDNI